MKQNWKRCILQFSTHVFLATSHSLLIFMFIYCRYKITVHKFNQHSCENTLQQLNQGFFLCVCVNLCHRINLMLHICSLTSKILCPGDNLVGKLHENYISMGMYTWNVQHYSRAQRTALYKGYGCLGVRYWVLQKNGFDSW